MILDAAPVPVFRHLNRLSAGPGVLERAGDAASSAPVGYRVDDAAHALVVVCREPRPAPNVYGLARQYLDFVLASVQRDGTCHSRMSLDGAWSDEPGLGVGWGRTLWGLGLAATAAPTTGLQERAVEGFRRAAKQRTVDLRAMAFGALGAAELLRVRPGERPARDLLADAVDTLWWDDCDDARPWPEPRLGLANGALAEAMILGGDLLSHNPALSRGFEMLAFLLSSETGEGCLSVTADEGGDQRPSEVAALADACASAYRIAQDQRWLDGIRAAWDWFLGQNDGGVPMFDPATGGGYDALSPAGRSAGQGAEATLAMLSTAQHARRFRSRW